MKPALLAAALVLVAPPATADQPVPIAEIARNASVTVAGTVDRLTDEGLVKPGELRPPVILSLDLER